MTEDKCIICGGNHNGLPCDKTRITCDRPTPETDAVAKTVHEGKCLETCDSFAHDEKCPVCFGEYLIADFARDLERKLQLCRDALKASQWLLTTQCDEWHEEAKIQAEKNAVVLAVTEPKL